MIRTLIIATLALAAPNSAQAETLDTSGLTDCGQVVATDAIGGARFHTEDGQTVKLALVKAPELWQPGAAYASWPHAVQSRDALFARVRGRTMTLYCEGNKLNADGELVAHAVMEDGAWLQQELVEAGNVFVFPRPTRRRGLDRLFLAEDGARAAKRGLWAFDNLSPVDAESRKVHPGWFQVVRGTVKKAEKVGTTLYLNFGEDWRTDFTVEIPTSALRHFEKAGVDPLTLAGHQVEARGWIDFKAGPRLLMQGPGQLRILD